MIYKKVPEQAKEAIERAMEESATGYQRAIQALEEAGAIDAIDDILDEPLILEGIPDKVKEKLEELIPHKKGRP